MSGKMRKLPLRKYVRKNWQLYSMLAVMVIVLAVFCYYPMLGIQLAFKDFRIAIGTQSGGIWGSPWATDDAGNLDLFKHFKSLFGNPDIFKTFLNTLRLSSLRILFGFPVPIIMAVFLNELTGEKYKKTVQSITYLPYFISWVIISGILTNLSATGSGLQKEGISIWQILQLLEQEAGEQHYPYYYIITDITLPSGRHWNRRSGC